MESGWEPGVKKYLLKILNTGSWTLIWMIAVATAGIYFQYAFISGGIKSTNIIYYSLTLVSGFILARYLYKTWNEDIRKS